MILPIWDCLTFCPDDSGNIWIGTIGNGLIKFIYQYFPFYISLKDVLQQSVYSIYSICYDDGNIWMGTDDGLYCYNIVGNRLMNFDKREDTQGQSLLSFGLYERNGRLDLFWRDKWFYRY